MPAKSYNKRYKLTLMPDGKRWRKKHHGKVYYFAIKEGETKLGSYARCLKEWEAVEQAERQAVITQAQREAMTTIKVVAHGLEYEGDDTYEQVVVDIPPCSVIDPDTTAVAEHIARLTTDTMGTLMDPRQQTIIRLGDEVARQVQRKEAEAGAGKLAFKSAKRYREQIKNFVRWAGEDTPLHLITAPRLLDFHSALLKEVQSGKRTSGGAKTVFQAVRHLFNTAYLMGSIDTLPKILAVKNNLLSFSGIEDKRDLKAERNYADDLDGLKTLLNHAKGRMKLYLLLCLNCGYQQTDIAELGQDEVDWEAGRICRKRSKGRKHKNVPEVDYLLWRETFTLLQEFKAGEKADHNIKGKPRCLVNANGTALVNEKTDTDAITLLYKRFIKSLPNETNAKPLASLRKTSATLIRRNKDYADCRYQFLGHSPETIADIHYAAPSKDTLDEAIRWLGVQYGIT